MTFFDWLNTPTGQDLVHAVVILISVSSAVIAAHNHVQIADVRGKLQEHIDQVERLNPPPPKPGA